MVRDPLSGLPEEDLRKKLEELKSKKYLSDSRMCINSFNFPRGKWKELSDITKIVRGKK